MIIWRNTTMVKIRLRRIGAKKNPFYRVVVADSRFPRDGRFIEEIGTYDPLKSPSEIKINTERAAYWIKNGAQPTDTVRALLKKARAAQPAPSAEPAEAAETVESVETVASAETAEPAAE
jgi:small subunit ribosomal protein S16